ncbi:MAG: hypothetical protein LBD30_07800, partial [Verrucomicrobiales bacterium]|nr:hypothetical protein [Verrucomicrobiales bacterium]
MNTNKLKKWTTLLTVSGIFRSRPADNVFCGFSRCFYRGSLALILGGLLLPLTVSAQENPGVSLIINGSSVTRSGTTYNNNGLVLDVKASGTFTGSDIILISASSRAAFIREQSTINLTNATLTGRVEGIQLHSSTLNFTSGTITATSVEGSGAALRLLASKAIVNDVTVIATSTSANGVGIMADGSSSQLSGTGWTVQTSGVYGMRADNGANIVGSDIDITSNGLGVFIDHGSSAILDRLTVTTSGNAAALLVQLRGVLIINGGTITTSNGVGARLEHHDDCFLQLNDVTLTTSGTDRPGINISSGTAGNKVLGINGGSVNSQQGAGINISLTHDAAFATINGGATVSGTVGLNIYGSKTNVATTVSVEESSSITGGANISGNTNVDLTLSGSSSLNGAVNTKDSAVVTINLDDSMLTGDVTGSGSSTL